MKFDSPVALATLIAVQSALGELADEYDEAGDTYAREVVENCIGHIKLKTGGTNQGTRDQQDRALAMLKDASPPDL